MEFRYREEEQASDAPDRVAIAILSHQKEKAPGSSSSLLQTRQYSASLPQQ